MLAHSEIYDIALGRYEYEIIFTLGHNYSISPQRLAMLKWDSNSDSELWSSEIICAG